MQIMTVLYYCYDPSCMQICGKINKKILTIITFSFLKILFYLNLEHEFSFSNNCQIDDKNHLYRRQSEIDVFSSDLLVWHILAAVKL